MGLFLGNLVELTLVTLTVLLFGRVLFSWVDPRGETQLGGFLRATTEPILAPVRRRLPATGMLDLSPLIVLVVLSLLLRLL